MQSPIIIHITDAHIRDPRRPDDAHKRLRQVFEHIARTEDPDRTVICDTGDLGWSMTKGEAEEIVWAFAPVRGWWRILCSQGNHDHGPKGLFWRRKNSDRWYDLVEDVTGSRPPHAPEIVVRRFRRTAFISANSARDQTFLARGKLGEDQIKNICAAVENANRRGQRSVLMLHHCPSGGNATKRLSDRRDLGEALKGVGRVDLMLTGHLHQDRQWSNILGSSRLISSAPITEEPMRYRRIWWAHGRIVMEWVDVPN